MTYNDWIRTGDAGKLSRFKTARSRTRAEVRRVKAQWLHDLAEKADLGRVNCSGATVWSSIRDIQRSFQGLRPVTVPLVRDDRGDVCRSSEEQSTRWSQHFQRVLNIESRFDMAVFDTLETRPIAEYLAVAPTLEELQRAISRLSNNKAPGSSGILPELIKHAGVAFRLSLLGIHIHTHIHTQTHTHTYTHTYTHIHTHTYTYTHTHTHTHTHTFDLGTPIAVGDDSSPMC